MRDIIFTYFEVISLAFLLFMYSADYVYSYYAPGRYTYTATWSIFEKIWWRASTWYSTYCPFFSVNNMYGLPCVFIGFLVCEYLSISTVICNSLFLYNDTICDRERECCCKWGALSKSRWQCESWKGEWKWQRRAKKVFIWPIYAHL